MNDTNFRERIKFFEFLYNTFIFIYFIFFNVQNLFNLNLCYQIKKNDF